MTREAAPIKATRYLAEGRLIVTAVANGKVTATARGDGAIHRLGYDGAWWCSCPARSDKCAHLYALRRVTAPDAGGWS